MSEAKYPVTLEIPPGGLCKNPWNSNIVSPENEEKLDEAIRRMGFFKPIIVRELPEGHADHGRYQILGGEHRWEAAIRIGLTTVPVFNVGQVSDARAKEISLADNARYGEDDSLQLAQILEELGDNEGIQSFLPYTDTDLNAIFSSVDIALDELDIDENPSLEKEKPAERESKPAKTHTIMRFKVPLGDAEKLTALIAKTQKIHGYDGSDEMTNAGDALVHLLLGASEEDAE